MIHGFGDVRLDLERQELRRGGELVDVQPQVFGVLAYLIEHRERVVTKHELLDAVWHHRFVTESALTSRIKSARKVIGDNGRDQRMIRTVHGRGYRFVAPVVDDLPDDALNRPPVLAADRWHDTPSLDALIERLDDGWGGAVAVSGPPGSGKTAALEHLRDRAAQAGRAVGYGSARLSALQTYGCIVDALDEMLHRDPGLVDGLPPGCRRELDLVLGGGSPTGRQRWHLSVRELLVHAARQRAGVLLAIDDMHLADPETVAMVAHLSRLGDQHAVTTVVAVRPGTEPLAGFTVVTLAGVAPAAEPPVPQLPDDVAEALRLLALVDGPFDVATVDVALGGDMTASLRLLDLVVAADLLEHGSDGTFRFRRAGDLTALVDGLPGHRRAAMHSLLGARFARADADPRRVAHHLLEAGKPAAAVPSVIRVARDAAAAELHREVLAWTERVLPHADGTDLVTLLTLRAESLTAVGDPSATQAYRQAMRAASADEARGLRAGLARAALLSGNIELAQEALEGLEPCGTPDDGAICLARGMLSYFLGDLDAAEEAADSARGLALEPGAPTRLLDVITLQGMIAHNRGEWSDRLFRELRTTGGSPEIASTVFDCHLCVAEYMLYGPTPYEDVVALAENLRRRADDIGAQRAVAFAVCVAGEAELLAGNLGAAEALLERSVALHRELLADTGLAHSLQRLAEVKLASGDRSTAERLGREALSLARWSPLSRHLLQRTYGTLIAAAPDLDTALEVVDEAAHVLDDPTACIFCQVMIAVPSAIACAEGGRFDEARRHLASAEMSAMAWQGTAWQGAVAEARACLVRAEGDEDEANRLLASAADLFDRAGQPVDAERCRDALPA